MRKLFPVLLLLMLSLGSLAQTRLPCAYKGGETDFLSKINCQKDYDYLKGKPLSEKFGKAYSVKIVYQIHSGKLFFLNSKKYPFHYRFCAAVLDVTEDPATFNSKNYRVNPAREYILCNLNYYSAPDVFALELMPEDDAKATTVNDLYKKIAALCFFSSKIKLMINSPEMEEKFSSQVGLPIIRAEEIYQNRQYVALNKGKTYGYLRRADSKVFETLSFDKHDIVLLNGLPNQLAVVAGVITTPFQTPLCHISLLCQNRGTPNSTIRNAWTDSRINTLMNKLVYYEVTADTFILKEASEAQAKLHWSKNENRRSVVLRVDTSVRILADLAKMSFSNVAIVGGKAANFAELLKVRVDKKPLPLPEGSFAIPFWFYCQHLKSNRLQPIVDSILNNPIVRNDPNLLSMNLKRLRDAIKSAPLSTELLSQIKSRLKLTPSYSNYRFRSSTNAEDVKGFNGAGLYDSKTGSMEDPEKPIDKAIKTVWASLWDDRAFTEREFFRIDQRSVAMGILVHRAFGEELANGVAVTKHMYRENYPAFTVNVQVGEISVVTPPDNTSCDEAIVGLGEITGSKDISIEYMMRSNLSKEKPVLKNEQVKLLCKYLTAIKNHYYYKVEKVRDRKESFWNYGLDVEFKIDAPTGNLYIKQARTL